MRILGAMAILLVLCGASFAQGINLMGDVPKDPVKEEKQREIERAYNATTQKIPVQKPATNDPWSNVRGTNEVGAKQAAGAKPKVR
ncbi:MAG: hypothetical protein AB7K04_09780 [Pseudorhodoplanes sp.]